eukprot:g16087.t1
MRCEGKGRRGSEIRKRLRDQGGSAFGSLSKRSRQQSSAAGYADGMIVRGIHFNFFFLRSDLLLPSSTCWSSFPRLSTVASAPVYFVSSTGSHRLNEEKGTRLGINRLNCSWSFA